jgi:hypothetical protein
LCRVIALRDLEGVSKPAQNWLRTGLAFLCTQLGWGDLLLFTCRSQGSLVLLLLLLLQTWLASHLIQRLDNRAYHRPYFHHLGGIVYGNVGACLGLYGVRAVYKMCVQDRVGAGLRVWGKGDKRRWRETQRESEVRGRRSGSVAKESTNAKGEKITK